MSDDTPQHDGPGATDFLTRAPAPSSPREADAGDHAQRLAIDLGRLFADDKCTQVVVLDVRGLSPITNFLVIASGTSERQMRSVLDHAEELAGERGITAHGVAKDAGAHWLIADFIDVVAHLFEPNTRALYDLEMLWGDARQVAWQRPGKAT
ncbi:MAG: ribosome silencing factor [Phycisphaerales bacterium]|nr:ribosome silencing factor [Phycisphaerales bacterium]